MKLFERLRGQHSADTDIAIDDTAKRAQKQQLFRAINSCKELLREPFLRAAPMKTLYRNGKAFQLLHSELQLLTALPTLLPTASAHLQSQIENFELSAELLQEKKAALDAQLPAFLATEAKLKSDIQAFTGAVKEAQTKYKLSPDWNGKKPALIQLGAQLQERRQSYEQAEGALDQQTEKLYALHAEFYQEFTLFCEEIIPLLETEFSRLSQG